MLTDDHFCTADPDRTLMFPFISARPVFNAYSLNDTRSLATQTNRIEPPDRLTSRTSSTYQWARNRTSTPHGDPSPPSARHSTTMRPALDGNYGGSTDPRTDGVREDLRVTLITLVGYSFESAIRSSHKTGIRERERQVKVY